MKIINIGVLAHVDAGKTTLTESLLYNSGAITELGSVDKGTTRTDNTLLERQRGITIQTGITSFQWENTKVNIIDTPGHMDFLAEVYRSLSVLDGAILLISAKDGVQAQTRILFHALRKMGIPTIFFINKIDQNGIDLSTVYQDIKEKLSAEIVIKQKVELYPNMCVTDCKICFKYGLYYSPVSTPADFRMLAPIVLEQVLKKAGTELLEPYLSFKIYAPQEYLSRAYNDAPKYCANIVDTQLKNNEVILSGEIPARCIQEYRSDLTFFTNGRSVCLTELKGYHVTTGEPVCQPRRPNSRIDKVRYMFNKIT